MTAEEFKRSRGLPLEIRALQEARQGFTIPSHRRYCDQIIAQRVLRLVEVNSIINQIQDPVQRKIVNSYLSGDRKTFETIAEDENYCLRTITRAFKAAINDLIARGILEDAENTPQTAL